MMLSSYLAMLLIENQRLSDPNNMDDISNWNWQLSQYLRIRCTVKI